MFKRSLIVYDLSTEEFSMVNIVRGHKRRLVGQGELKGYMQLVSENCFKYFCARLYIAIIINGEVAILIQQGKNGFTSFKAFRCKRVFKF